MGKKAEVPHPIVPLDFAGDPALPSLVQEWAAYRRSARLPMTERAWVLFWNMLRDACDGDTRRAPLVIAWCIGRQFQGIFRPRAPWPEVARLVGLPLPAEGGRPRLSIVRETPGQLASRAEDELIVIRHDLSPRDFDAYMQLIRAREERADVTGLGSLIDELRERARQAAFEGVRAGGSGGDAS